MGDITNNDFVDIGEVSGSSFKVGKAVEFKMPLNMFEDTSGLKIVNISPMAGKCCDENWYAIDQVESIEVV